MANESRYSIMFWCEMDSDNSFEKDGEGRPLVRVGISTKPDRSMNWEIKNSTKNIFVFYIGKIKSHNKFLVEIEELQISKGLYLLEPLSALLKRKCKECDFKPYVMKNSKARAKSDTRGQLDL